MKKLIAFAMILMLLGAAFAESTTPIASRETNSPPIVGEGQGWGQYLPNRRSIKAPTPTPSS